MQDQTITNKINKPFYKKWWFWVVAVVVIISIGNTGNKTNNDRPQQNAKIENTPQVQKASYNFVTPENSLDRQIEQKVIDVLQEKNSTGKARVIGVEVNKYNTNELKAYGFQSGANVESILIKINASENLTTKLQKATMDQEAFDIFKNVFGLSNDIGDVIVWSYLPVKDQYGNTKDDVAVVFSMGRPLFAKINWSGMNHRELPNLLESETAKDDRNSYFEKIKF